MSPGPGVEMSQGPRVGAGSGGGAPQPIYTSDPWKDVPENYKVRFLSRPGGTSRKPLKVMGIIPEAVTEATASRWTAPLQGIFSTLARASRGTEAARRFLTKVVEMQKEKREGREAAAQFSQAIQEVSSDWSALNLAASQQLWEGSEPIEIPLTLHFMARSDATKDVLEPARILQSFTVPKRGDYGFLYAPPRVDVQIGRILSLNDSIITSASIQWGTELDEKGVPTFAEVSVSVRSNVIYHLTEEQDWIGQGEEL